MIIWDKLEKFNLEKRLTKKLYLNQKLYKLVEEIN